MKRLMLLAPLYLSACFQINDNELNPQAIAAIESIERHRIAAMMKNSAAEMDSLLAPDMIHITTDGTRRTKQEYLQQMRSKKSKFIQFQILEREVRFYGNIAVTTGMYQNQKSELGGEAPIKTARFTRVYRLGDHGWRLVSHQATKAG